MLGPPDVLGYATLNLQGRILGIGLSIRVGILCRRQVCSRDDLWTSGSAAGFLRWVFDVTHILPYSLPRWSGFD